MAGEFEAAISVLRRSVGALEPASLDGRDAAVLLELVIEGKKLLGAAETLLAKRVDECRVWAAEGHRGMADWLAARSGTSVRQAVTVVETSQRLGSCAATEAALRDGRISTEQAHEIAAAAQVDPAAESRLLSSADVDGFQGLRDQCRRVTAAAMSEAELVARHQRIHDGRYHRRWTDADGAACGRYRLTAQAAAGFWAELDGERDRIFKAARAAGEREPFEAYEADALCALADRDARSHRGTRMTALLRIDASAIRAKATEPGETCEIAGIGPVSVAAARDLIGDALLKVLVTDGVDVRTVVHPNRTIASTIRTALLWQHPECSVTGCHETHGLEHHHTVDYVDTKHTKLDELTLICARHHDLVSHRGFRLEPRPDGGYELIAPGRGTGDETGSTMSDERGPPVAA